MKKLNIQRIKASCGKIKQLIRNLKSTALDAYFDLKPAASRCYDYYFYGLGGDCLDFYKYTIPNFLLDRGIREESSGYKLFRAVHRALTPLFCAVLLTALYTPYPLYIAYVILELLWRFCGYCLASISDIVSLIQNLRGGGLNTT